MAVVRVTENETLFSFIDELKQSYDTMQVVGTTSHHEKSIEEIDFTRPTLLLIGNETDGLNNTLKEHSDVMATIPMSRCAAASSLNVGCAATVLFYEAIRQRM